MARSPARGASGQGGRANADGRGSDGSRSRRTAPSARSVALAAAALAIVSSLALGSVEQMPQQLGQEDRLQPLMMMLPAAYASHYEACPVGMYSDVSEDVSISYTSPNGTYILGGVIGIRVNVTEGFNSTDDLSHTRVKLDTGAAGDRFAVHESNATGSIDYNYTVQEGDQSDDLDYASSSSLYWRNGTAGNVVQNRTGSDYNCRLPEPGNASSLAGQGDIVLDGVVPLVRNVSAAVPDGAYAAGKVIRINVSFSEAVRFPGSAMPQPTLALSLDGPSNRTAAYESGNGTAVLAFNYTVRANDNAGRLDYNTTGALVGTNITDMAGNAANLALPELGAPDSLAGQSAIALDNTAPLVRSVSAAVPDGAYAAGQVIRINVNFSEAVRFPGSAMPQQQPTLTLAFDGPTNRTAAYESGNNTAALAFNYTVRAEDDTGRLDYSGNGALAGMNITDFAGNAANLTLPGPRETGSLWDTSRIAAMTAPSVESVSSPTAAGTYTVNDTITVRVAFTENVTVLAPNGGSEPYALLDVGVGPEHAAPYSSGNGTAALDFSYTVRAGAWTDSLNHASISLNGSSIADAAGNAADLALPDPAGSASLAAASPGIRLEAPPVVVRVSSPNATATYGQGDAIVIDVNFTGPVAVGAAPGAGVPLLTLETGATDRDAAYASGNGTGTLSFAYTVMPGDEAADLGYAGANALRTNGGMLNGTGAAAGQAALLALPDPAGPNSLAGTSDIAVDGVAPSVARVSSPGGNATYAVGDAVAVRVTFTENVTVAGAPADAPALALNVSGAAAPAPYASGNGTDTLSFAYTVREGDEAADLDYAGTGALAGGASIADAAGNAANTTLPAQPGAPGSLGALYDIVLDGAAPTVARVTSPNASGTYGAGDLVSVVVEMTRNVTVSGASEPPLYLYLDAGGAAAVPAPYASGSGTASLAFSYTVADGDGTARLAYPNSTALVLNGTDAAVAGLNGAAANLTLPDPGADGSLSGPSPPAPAIAIETGDPPPPPIAGVSLVNASLTGPNTVTVYYNASISAAASSYANLTLSPGGDRNVTSLAAGNNTSVHTLAFDGPKAQSDADGTMSIAPLLNASARFAGDPAVDVLDGQPYPFVHAVTTRNATGSAHTGNATVLINVMFSEEVYVRELKATGRGEGSQVATFATGVAITTMFIELDTGRNATLPEQLVNASRSYDFIYKIQIGDDSDGILGYINSSSLRTNSDFVVINDTLKGNDGLPLLDVSGFPVPGQESADLTLPVPGSPDSLSGSGRLYVYEAPLIASLSVPPGTYGVGSTLPVTVNLTRSLSVAGGNAALELGSPSKSAEYASGNGTATYAFSYRVQQGDSARTLFAQPTIAVPAGAAAYLSTSTGSLFKITPDDAAAATTVVGGGDAAADPSARPILDISGVNVVGAADRRPTTQTVVPPAPVVVASGGFGGGGGGGGGRGGGSGGVGLAIGAGGVTLYSASWDCAEGVIRIVLNEDAYIPDVTVLSSSGSEVAAKSEAQDLPGRTVYEAALSDDTILSIRAVSVDGRAVSTASEVVRTGGACTGDVTFTAYTGPGAAPRQQPAVPDDDARGMMPPDDDDDRAGDDDARPQPPRPDARPAPTDGDDMADGDDAPPPPPPAMSDRPAFEIEADRDASYYVKRYAEQPEYRQWFDDAYPQYADICEAVGVGSGCVEDYMQQRDDALGADADDAAAECAEGMVMRDGECVDDPAVVTPPQPTATTDDDDDSGCLIATAAFGTELAPQVQLLREVRDGTVLSTSAGSAFMASFSSAYYAFSPHVADLEREFPAVRHAAALLLTPMLYALQVVELAEPGSERDVLAYGIAAIALVAGMYVAAPAAGAWYACRRISARRLHHCRR